MRKRNLLLPQDFEDIKNRIDRLNAHSERKWGKMQVGQMLRHCNKIIQVSTGIVTLPKINPALKLIGIITKKEMRLLNNGIPPCMPTFRMVCVDEHCNFDSSKEELLESLDEFLRKAETANLLREHQLFGTMTTHDWGFMHYKHLNHHLKQFGV